MLLFAFAVCCQISVIFSASSSDTITELVNKYKTTAAWVFNSSDNNIFSSTNGKINFKSLANDISLTSGGKSDILKTSQETYNGMTIPFVDFGQADNDQNSAILYSDDDLLNIKGSFTIIVVYKKNTPQGFEDDGFLAGKWEECDRSRSYGLFGELGLFKGKNCIGAHTSNTGLTSEPKCDWAHDATCSRTINNANNNSIWHTAAMVWNSSVNAVRISNSSENKTECSKNGESPECPSGSQSCSSLQSFVDGEGGEIKYYKYRSVYQGTGTYFNHSQRLSNIKRRALFTVGGTAAKHSWQPDSKKKREFPTYYFLEEMQAS